MQLTAEATAQNGSLPFAIVLLQQAYSSSYDNLTMNGNPSSITLTGGGGAADRGGIYSNASLSLGSGQIVFGSQNPSNNCPTGGVGGTGNSGDVWAVSPTPLTSTQVLCPETSNPARSTTYVLPDPGYPEPPAPSTNISNGATVLNGTTTYLCPGQYGNKINVQAGATGILLPGVFHVQAGGVSVGGTLRTLNQNELTTGTTISTDCGNLTVPSSWASGDLGVVLEITPANASGMTNCNQHQFAAAGGSTVTLVPSPKYLNISVYVETMPNWQSVCSAAPTGTNVVAIAGGANYSIYGSIYGPADNMSIGGGGGGAGVGQIIAWTMTVNGNGNVNEMYDPSKVPYIKGLIE
jgi:hypothetical protein